MKTWTRRDALAAGAAGTLAGVTACRTAPQHAGLVSIHKAPAYGPGLYDLCRRVVAAHKLDVRGKRVVLKPNLVEFDSATCVNTHPMLVHAVLEAFRAQGAQSVRIAEGPGHRRITLDLADAAGYFSVIPGFEDLFVDLNLDDVSEKKIARPASRLQSLYLPHTVLGCDLLVSLPKMKTHHWVGATLSMKNFFGLVPGSVYGWPKNILHWAGIDESIADIHTLVPPTFAIVDGIVGMEGNGPIQGTPKPVGVLVAGAHLPAVDSTCCQIMGLDPAAIGYLKLATGGVAPVITLDGEPLSAVKTPFAVIPEMQGRRAT